MRKLVFLPIVVASMLADFGAFGAATRGSRSAATKTNADENNAVMTTAPITARAAVRGTKAMSATQSVSQGAPTTARAAVRGAAATVSTSQPVQQTASVTARAAAKQKVINMGTKVSAATANTVVSQECQDAYFGCMDSFCMLENVTGGRCKCSDKNAEYDGILADIMNLDQQSYIMQTEGVSLLRMGKSADEVYAMAEDAANKVSKDKKAEEPEGKKTDFTDWIKKLSEDDEDIWEDEDAIALESDLTSKTGDKLHAIAASTCTQQVPTQCKSSTPILRMIYVQKIQSDCAAYDNSLRQQQMESNQKLQTARQSLRDAALEEYQKANKYDLGGCVTAFNTCMQKEEVCGDGFLGCVTFAATDNLKNDKSGSVADQTEIEFAHSKIKLAKTTMDELVSKRVFCDSVLEQCVNANVNDAVWTAFLKSAAPAIKTAESDAESNLRMNCVKEVSECFQTACKEQMDTNNEKGSYDICLSNPNLYKSLCKPKLEPCLLATGGTYDDPGSSSLWTALLARLSSMKVDACTKEVRDCLLSEDRCGKDYGGCIGLSTYDIGQLCPVEKLTACRDDRTEMSEEARAQDIRDYVAKVAQGIALNIDNSMLAHCQTALKTAMLTFCGAEDSCPNAAVDENMFKDIMSVQLCPLNPTSKSQCSTDPYTFPDQKLIDGEVTPMLLGKIDLSAIEYKLDNASADATNSDTTKATFKSVSAMKTDPFGLVGDEKYVSPEREPLYSVDQLKRVVRTLNTNFKTIVNSIESDPKVVYCTSGRKVQGFDEDKFIGAKSGKANARFPNLTQNIRAIVAQELLVATSPIYFDNMQKVAEEQMPVVTKNMSDRINEFVQITQEKQHAINEAACSKLARSGSKPSCHGCTYNEYRHVPKYNRETWTCDVEFTHWRRKSGNYCGCANPFVEDIEHKLFAMPRLTREDLRNVENINDVVKKENYIQDTLGIKDKGKDITAY